MSRVLIVAARESFKTSLREYKKSFALGSDDRHHLQRWIDDDRTEQVWAEIQYAARSKNPWLPRVAKAIPHQRKLREHYRRAAKEMERVAKFLRKPHPYGMPGYPKSTTLARMLDDAASYYRTTVEPSRNVPGVLKFGRQSQSHMIFTNMVSNELKRTTGRWLDEKVGVLAEIAFDSADIIDPEAVRGVRRQRKKSRPDSR
jgi:hypothetical protein